MGTALWPLGGRHPHDTHEGALEDQVLAAP